MIPVSQATSTALHQAVKQIRARIAWQDDQEETRSITSDDRIISLKKEAEGYYCKSTLRKLTIQLAGTDTNILDRRIIATVQVKTGADTWGDISWGSFTVTEATIDEEKGTSTFVAYGGIAQMQAIEYTPGDLTFPTTVAGLAEQIGAKFGIEIETDLTTLPNYDAPIEEDLWAKITGTTYLDILEEIAGATGTIAVIGRGNDQLDFDLPPIDTTTETLTEDNLITAKIGEKWGKVSAVVLSRQPQGDNVEVVDTDTADLPAGKNQVQATYGQQLQLQRCAGESYGNGIKLTRTQASGAAYASFAIPNELLGQTLTLSFSKSGTTAAPKIYDYKNDQAQNLVANLSADGGTFTLPDEIPTDRQGFCIVFYVGSGDTSTHAEYWDVQLEKGEEPTPYEPFKYNGRVDLVIANNEILDPQRETTATPILNAVKGWEYRNAEIKTEGHGYHEIGDRVDISVAGETYPAIITKSTIQVDGGIKETLISATPEIVPIDYAKAGGITKTVFRTELAVDKQEQRIDGIVSRQDATDIEVAEQFTQLTQDLEGFVAIVQQSGGGNLIRNSVGYGKDSSGILTIWQYGAGADANTVRSQSSPASLNAGAVSGYEIMLTGATEISQPIALTPGETYTLSARAQKAVTGSATITLGNGTNSVVLDFPDQTASAWQKKSVEFTPDEGANIITLASTAGTTIEITDLMLATGGKTTWRQASGEIYNTQVSLDQDGVRVSSSVYAGDYVEITPLEFAGYSNAGGSVQKVFSLNRDTTVVEKLEARSQIKMPPIKIVPFNNHNYSGWAFVKEDN